MNQPLTTTSDWNFDLIEKFYKEIEIIAVEELGLDVYPNQIEIISAEQMLDCYSSVGMPILYNHWSFGKEFVRNHKNYKQGHMGLAYEIVLNTNPCLVYLMEENTIMMQALVMAHAAFGHNAFFKNNYMFKQWTHADTIVDYLIFAKHYITECEEKYGTRRVELLLDACHSIQEYGVDKYKRVGKLSPQKEREKQQDREKYIQSQLSDIWRTLPPIEEKRSRAEIKRFPSEPQENILYFLEKNAPKLDSWEREIIRIVRKISQYFYPQRHTKLMNEGFACVTGDTLIDTLDGFIRADELVTLKYNGTIFDGKENQRVVNWFTNFNQKRVKIITHHGYELHGGATHKILIDEEWIELQHIKLGQKININRGNNVWASDCVQLPAYSVPTRLNLNELCKHYGVHINTYYKWINASGVVSEEKAALCQRIFDDFEKNKHLTTKSLISSNRVDVKFPTILDERFAYWLGLLIGDGNVHVGKHKFVGFTNQTEELLTFFTQFSEQTFGVQCSRISDRNHVKIKFNSNSIVEFLVDVLNIKHGKAAEIKEVPLFILQSPQSVVAAFLRGHFDTDGHVSKNGNVILTSKSKQLITTEQQLLLKMGIVCRVSQQRADGCYRLSIGGVDLEYFDHLIGFGVEYKKRILQEAISKSQWRLVKQDTTYVSSIEYDEGTTYDFSVENSHCYKASCFINHNCFIHYTIMHRLREKGLITDGFMLEFARDHSNVIYQPGFDSKYYSSINPYALGFAMFRDIQRICEDPTDEDREWFPDIAGKSDWMGIIKHIVANFKDDSFILQYLSPKVMRDFRMFALKDPREHEFYEITAIQNEEGFKYIRSLLAKQHDPNISIPDIQVVEVDRWGDRKLNLQHKINNGRLLERKHTENVLSLMKTIWKYDIVLRSVNEDGITEAVYGS